MLLWDCRKIEAKCNTPMTALSPAKVTERLGLNTMKDRSWYVHPRYVFCRFDDQLVL